MKERIVNILISPNKSKKYLAMIYNAETKKVRKIHFGARGYAQYKDSTKLKAYSQKDHGNTKRIENYFSRHSGVKGKRAALALEKRKSNGIYNAKILSHTYLW